MPLYKRKPFPLVVKPEDLDPQELVFQIPFTKEILRSYNDYVKRLNFYRQRVWTCKATGKGNLTYEEALISEEKASKRIQNIPAQYVALVLRDVQFSMLNLKDLVNSISAKVQGPFTEGAEVYGKKDGRLYLCKVTKVVEGSDKTQYEIEWLGGNHKMNEKALVNGEDLKDKNPPFSKRVLKSFIKDSTYRSLPWVLHDNIAKKHGISTTPPKELKTKYILQNGLIVCNRKRKRGEETQKAVMEGEKEIKVYIRRKKMKSNSSPPGVSTDDATENIEDQSIKYPIEDLLVKPTEEDQLLTERPSPGRDFMVPMDCVGDLLMVWDFCTSFGKLLNLFPFSLQDFETSLCYSDATPVLLVEMCSALLRFLIKDNGKFSLVIEKKKRKPKIRPSAWTDYLCDFLETCPNELSLQISTIKRGHYCLLEVPVKLVIFSELVGQVLDTEALKDKLDEHVEERQALAAARRDEALIEGRKRREEKERKKAAASAKDLKESSGAISNGYISEKNNRENGQENGTSKKKARKRKIDINSSSEDVNGNHPSKREIHKLMKNEIKESIEKKSVEERKEFLEREIEKRVIRTSPLGKDRDHRTYWFYRRDGRIFVENSNSTEWGYYENKDQLDALIGSLNTKGMRERALKKQLQKFYSKICSEIEKRSKVHSEKIATDEAMVRKSSRIRGPPGGNPAHSFINYVNKWKEM
ncbi:uncharacterized protein LOC127248630 [Andrographis paniculata]|uniref:uncharacterized protein LOC127248630 n=1 Tax=Andrographis paniculata TaxID=175694 RepID=UPI0021E76980|nr:uncharacterized protein LOC127248630 [Andrographis paniculata]